MFPVWIAVAFVAGQPDNATSGGQSRTVQVTGEGTATAAPDMAVIHTGVTTQADTAGEALEANNKAMGQVMATVKKFGIAPKDVQTSRFDVHPVYEQDPNRRVRREIVGYRVTNQARVKVRKLSELGKVLDALVQSGSNELSGITFDVGDPEDVMDKARREAATDARRRANLYAEALGVRLGAVQTISEEPINPPRPMMYSRAAVAEAAGSVPVATGENEYRARVHVVFALEGGAAKK